MTAFSDYLDLRTAALELVGRTDIADTFDRAVKMAEARLNRELRTRAQIAESALTVSGGTAALPSDFLEVIALYDGSGLEMPVQTTRFARSTWQTAFHAISGSSLVGPDGDVTLQYYAALPSLTSSMTASNWLLQRYPDLYLYAAASEAAKQARDVEGAQAFEALRAQALAGVMADDSAARYARAAVRVVGVTP